MSKRRSSRDPQRKSKWLAGGKTRDSAGASDDGYLLNTHWDSIVTLNSHRYETAWAGHGPFFTIKIWKSLGSPMCFAGVELERDQVEQLVAVANHWLLENSYDGPRSAVSIGGQA